MPGSYMVRIVGDVLIRGVELLGLSQDGVGRVHHEKQIRPNQNNQPQQQFHPYFIAAWLHECNHKGIRS